MESYFQVIIIGIGTGLLVGITIFILNWGAKVAYRLLGGE
jgi:hypothetical protein